MFEAFLQRTLEAIGASDQAIAVMGPTFTMLLAVIGGTAVAQFLKFPMSECVKDEGRFSWYVRSIAIMFTFFFAHILSDSVPWALEIFIAMCQPLIYHATLRVIRRWWPWLEMKPFVGAVCPPPAAQIAAIERAAEKS